MASLEKLIARDDAIYHPTHGEPVTEPQRFVKHLLAHRRQRENQVIRAIGEGLVTVPQMVAAMYAQVDKRLHPAAGRSVLAHLIDLQRRGRVVRADDVWSLA
jgi:glyoxylase-like metal-dependent hydrolase (beta-lactamase superfamily II)